MTPGLVLEPSQKIKLNPQIDSHCGANAFAKRLEEKRAPLLTNRTLRRRV
jgi:hypothetical protein